MNFCIVIQNDILGVDKSLLMTYNEITTKGEHPKRKEVNKMTNTKLYPFSTAKHAHDIEYRRNRVKNELSDYFAGEIELSDSDFDKLLNLEESLTDLLLAVLNSSDGRICYLTGKQIGLAKECVVWAESRRASAI